MRSHSALSSVLWRAIRPAAGRTHRRAALAVLLVGLALFLPGCQGVIPASGRSAPALATPPPSPAASPTLTAAPPTPTVPPTAAPSPTATPSGPVPTGSGPLRLPTRLRIPRIHVDASVEVVGLEANGTMSAPRRFEDVGWYGYGPIPGEPGASVIAGHVDSVHGPAVFWSLHELRPGDRIEIDLLGGTTLQFVVEGTGSYPSDEAPLSTIFTLAGPPRLNLITCGGIFDRVRRAYDQRLVVYARLAGPGGTGLPGSAAGPTARVPALAALAPGELPSSSPAAVRIGPHRDSASSGDASES
jgi:sortase (surface protein transpeptidase)